jgi:hypothetical protein
MQVRNDFLDPERNKSKDKFPINKHKPIFLIGVDSKGNIYNEYAQDEKEVKEILLMLNDTCKKGSIKIYRPIKKS